MIVSGHEKKSLGVVSVTEVTYTSCREVARVPARRDIPI